MNTDTVKIAVLGAGLIGKSWSLVFARAGYSVALYDPVSRVLDTANVELLELASTMLPAGQSSAQTLNVPERAREIVDRIRLCETLQDCVAGADYVQECGPEQIDFKQTIFAELDQLVGAETVLASSSSALVASSFSEKLEGRFRILVAHPVNPPHLVPLVELCPSPWTSPVVVDRAWQLMQQVEQTPILVKKEIDGFILNRLQAAVLNEAVRLVGDDCVSAEDLDKTIRDGLGLRWSFMGPFETIDMNAPGGVRDYASRYSPFFRRVVKSQSTEPDWEHGTLDQIDAYCRSRVKLDELPQRSRWRDGRLRDLRQHKSLADKAEDN